jgi:hypothetical protein
MVLAGLLSTGEIGHLVKASGYTLFVGIAFSERVILQLRKLLQYTGRIFVPSGLAQQGMARTRQFLIVGDSLFRGMGLVSLTDAINTTSAQGREHVSRQLVNQIATGDCYRGKSKTVEGHLSQPSGCEEQRPRPVDASSGEFERLKEFGISASKSGDQVRLNFKGVNTTAAPSWRWPAPGWCSMPSRSPST